MLSRWRSKKRLSQRQHASGRRNTLLLPWFYTILAFYFSKKNIRSFQCERVSSFGQMSQRLRSCFRRVGRLDSPSPATHSSLRNIKNVYLPPTWRLGVLGFGEKHLWWRTCSKLLLFFSYRTFVFADHQKNNWLDICAAGWHQQKRVRATICFEILRLATFGLPSCKTLIFGSPTLKNKTTCLDVGVRAVLWVKAQYVV